MANWFAAPFGTAEYLFKVYGTEGVHYNMRNGGPARTQQGVAQTGPGIIYIVDAPSVIFIAGNADATRRSHEFQSSIIPTSVKDPMVGLYSDTWSRKQGQLGQIINDGQQDIISRRKPVSSWDDVVKTGSRPAATRCAPSSRRPSSAAEASVDDPLIEQDRTGSPRIDTQSDKCQR